MFDGDGTSDRALVRLLELLLQDCGPDVLFSLDWINPAFTPAVSRRVPDRLERTTKLYPKASAVFLHRDAERDSMESRCDEVKRGVNKSYRRSPSGSNLNRPFGLHPVRGARRPNNTPKGPWDPFDSGRKTRWTTTPRSASSRLNLNTRQNGRAWKIRWLVTESAKMSVKVHRVMQDTKNSHAIFGRVVGVENDMPCIPARPFQLMAEYAGTDSPARTPDRRVFCDAAVCLFDQVEVLPVLPFSPALQRVAQNLYNVRLRLFSYEERCHP